MGPIPGAGSTSGASRIGGGRWPGIAREVHAARGSLVSLGMTAQKQRLGQKQRLVKSKNADCGAEISNGAGTRDELEWCNCDHQSCTAGTQS